MDPNSKVRLFKGMGCDVCGKTGYKGRVGVYEVLEINEEMRQLIVRRAPPYEIRQAAQKTGVESLREVAVKKLFAGITSIQEVIRVTISEDNNSE